MTTTYETNIRELADLETFPSSVFLADDKCSKGVCNFILALAVLHNDLNDLDLAMELLASQEPKGAKTRTKSWGKHIGLSLHIVRLIVSAVHELTIVISKNLPVLGDPAFVKVYKALKKEHRARWDQLVAVARGDQIEHAALGHYLMMARNKIGSHYDINRIGQGYRAKFGNGQNESPLISRGNTRNTTRFYFADAAAEEVLFMDGDGDMIDGVLRGHDQIYADINVTVYHLVTKFLQQRAGSFRAFRNDPTFTPLTPLERRKLQK